MPKASIFLLVLLSICFSSQQTATTEDGKKVILLDNFTWKYVTQGNAESNSDQSKDNSGSITNAVVKDGNSENTDDRSKDNRLSLVDIIKNDTSFDFRKVRWGMGKQQVRSSETGKFISNSSDSLQYGLEFLGYNCTITYLFLNDKLSKAILLIEQPHVDPAMYYDDYEKLKNYLSPIYKNQVSDRCDWNNEIYKSDRSKWGFAVSIGFLTCETQWKNSRTAIVLKISGGNHEIATKIEYLNSSK